MSDSDSNDREEKKPELYFPELQTLKSKINTRITYADTDAATAIRQQYNARFSHEPFFREAADTLRAAEAAAPSLPSAAHKNAAAGAMADLRAQLAGIRSSQQGLHQTATGDGAAMVPTATVGEIRLRSTISFDAATPESAAAIAEKKNKSGDASGTTSLQLEMRPLNRAAFTKLRETLLEKTGIPVQLGGDGDVDAVFEARFKLRDDAPRAEVDRMLNIIRLMCPRESDLEGMEGNLTSLPMTGVRVDDAHNHVVFTVVDRGTERDPLEKAMVSFARSLLDFSRGDSREGLVADSLPDMLRLVCIKAHLPHSLAEFTKKGCEANLYSLLEGATVAAEAVLKDDGAKKVAESLLLGHVLNMQHADPDEFRAAVSSYTLPSLVQSLSVHAKLAPPTLTFGQGVRDGGHALRRIHETVGSNMGQMESAVAFVDKISGTGCEDCIASLMASFLQMGLTPPTIVNYVQRLAALAILTGEDDVTAKSLAVGDDVKETMPYYGGLLFESIQRLVSGLSSFRAVSHSFDVQLLGLRGFSVDILNVMNPKKTREGIIEKAKAASLAHRSEFREYDDSSPIGYFLTSRDVDPDESFSRNVASEKIDMILKRLTVGEPDTDLVHTRVPWGPVLNDVHERNSHFIVVVLSDFTKDNWAKVLQLWGVQPYGVKEDDAKKKKKSKNKTSDDDDDNDSGDDDEEEEPTLPAPDEGAMRCAYVKQPDGRYVHFIRPLANCPRGPAFLGAADAVVVVDQLRNTLESLPSRSSPGSRRYSPHASVGDFIGMNSAPVLFVGTDSKVLTAQKLGKWPLDELHVPSAIDYQQLPEPAEEQAAWAKQAMAWLVKHSARPERGTQDAVPSSAFDWPVEHNIMLA